MILALLPAAGKSTRMGRPKLALPLGEKTVLEHVLGALRQAGVDHTLVVVGPHVADLVPLAEREGARTLLLDQETPDMRATIEKGLHHLEELYHPVAEDAWLLCPADHPALKPDIIRRLVMASRNAPAYSVLVPTFLGQRGHPTLLLWKHVAGITNFPPNQGLNAYLRLLPEETLEVPVDSTEILHDLDTPEDYERLSSSW